MTVETQTARLATQVAAAATIGSVIEWYDFYVYGTSAVLVFGPLFFPTMDPVTGALLAFSTFGVGFFARPLGAVVLSNLGDRVGRKQALVCSLLLMGGATVAVGLLPTYDQAGLWAPALLILLRLVQGFAVGGEWGGAALLVVEHAPPGRRALWGTFPQYGTAVGLLASSLAILWARVRPEEDFMTWGWRLPFLASALLVVVGLWLRWRVEDADEFVAVRERGAAQRRPVVHLLSAHRRAVVIGTMTCLISHAAYLLSGFLPSYATSVLGATDRSALLGLILGSMCGVVVLFVTGLWARHGDPRRIALTGAIAIGLWALPAFVLADQAGGVGLLVGVAVSIGLLQLHYGVLPALLAAQFPADVRYSGVSVCFQASAVLAGGLLPILASNWTASSGAFGPAVALIVAAALVSSLGIGLLRWDRTRS
jgi:MFS family permease